MRIKSMAHRAYAHFLDSELCSEACRYGDEVARLRAAKTLCETMVKLIKAEKGKRALRGLCCVHLSCSLRLAEQVGICVV